MAYASLIVHLDLDRSNEARLRVAHSLAGIFGARLIGLAAADFEPMYFADGPVAQSFIDSERRDLDQRMRTLGAEFAGGNPDTQWRQGLTRPGRFVVSEARAADLIICGPAPRGSLDETREVDPARLVMQGGRPVLLVPDDVKAFDTITALIAWKDTREARRAVADSLPLLKRAEKVVLATILDNGAESAQASTSAADVVRWLDRHGVAVQVRTATAKSVTGALSTMVENEGINVMISGAYGHSRAQEAVFGGVTRGLLAAPPCALFLSH